MIDGISDILEDIKTKLMYYIGVVILYGFIIYAFRKTNQFYGLNENSDLIDCIYYTSIVFTGSGYGEIYPQTQLSRIIILSLSILKLIIIVLPFESFPEDKLVVKDNIITVKDVEEVVEEIKNLHIDFNPNDVITD
tara:strand:+ start:709 stop:1116 length:408 start_codon:yes stop_codon:yes gene_type:complete